MTWHKRILRTSTKPKLELTDVGFQVNGSSQLSWSNVQQVRGFKTDNLTTDEIWLEFTREDGSQLLVSEEWEGFAAVAAQMAVNLPSTSQWHALLARPAFTRSETILFRRQSNAPTGTPRGES